MSHSFYLSPVKDLRYDETLAAVGIDNLVTTDDSPRPEDGRWPTGEIYLYIDNLSVRPLELSYDGETLQVRIFQASSTDDYELARKLAIAVAGRHNTAIQPEDSTDLSIDDFERLYGQQWAEEHLRSMVEVLVSMWQKQKDGVYTLSGTRSELKVGSRTMAGLLRDREHFVANFMANFRRLNYIDREDIHIASIMVYGPKHDPKKELRVAVYGAGVPTLLPTEADLIALHCDGGTPLYIEIDQLAELLENKATWLSESHLLAPQLEGAEWERLEIIAAPYQIADPFSVARNMEPADDTAQDNPDSESGGIEMSTQQCLVKEDWVTLLYCPYLVFFTVAGADGGIDKKELKAFEELLTKGFAFKNELLSAVMVAAIPEAARIMTEFVEGEVDPVAMIERIQVIIDENLDAAAANEFKLGLIYVGKEIASASGGFLGRFGNKIDKNEMRALAGLAALLQVNFPE